MTRMGGECASSLTRFAEAQSLSSGLESNAAVIGAGVGAIYGGAIAGPGARSLLVSLLISIPIGVIAALLTASLIAGIEIFLLRHASMRWLDALPFAAVFILKTLVYGAIAGVVFVGQPGQRLLGVVEHSDGSAIPPRPARSTPR